MPKQMLTLVPKDLNEDQCTLISIVPFLINEFKPGIYPGRFTIQPCLNPNEPAFLYVGDSVHFIPQFSGDDAMPPIVIRTGSRDIAKAVVYDYLQGQMNVDEFCGPGLAWLPGKLDFETNKDGMFYLKLNPDLIKLLLVLTKKQHAWFDKLVKQADNDWNRYKRHTVISDNQRFAARALGLEKDWMTVDHDSVPVKCPSCLQNCDPRAIVCANCRCVLDQARYKTLSFAS